MTGAIYFNNTELLGYSHNCNYWGNIENYSNIQTYTLQGYITGSNYSENISGVVSQISGISSFTTSGVSNIYVNNLYIGLGTVRSINFDQSNDSRIRRYSASVEIPLLAGTGMFSGTGAITNTGGYFLSSGENLTSFFISDTGRYIKNFILEQNSEKLAKDKYGYAKSASFTIDPEIYDQYSVYPEAYASRLFGAVARTHGDEFLLSEQYPNFYKIGSGISKTTQSFNVTDGSFSYQESFIYEKDLPYTWKYNHSLSYDGDAVSVDERGVIKSTSFSGTNFAPAQTAWQSIKTGVFSRCSGVLTGYPDFANLCGPLSTYPITSSTVNNECEETITYSQSFSTNPFIRSGYIYSYDNSIQYGEDGYFNISENGSFKALNNINSTGFNIVLAAYSSEKPSITGRISGLYTNSISGYNYLCGMTGVLSSISKSESYNEYNPEVSYSWASSNNPRYISDSTSYLNDISFSDNKSIHAFNYFPILNDKIIPQSASQAERGQFSNSINLVTKSGVSISSMVTRALTGVAKPSGTDIYAKNYTYSFSPTSKRFSLGLDYVYTYYRNKDNYLAY